MLKYDKGKAYTQALFAANFPDEKGHPQALKQYAGTIAITQASLHGKARTKSPKN